MTDRRTTPSGWAQSIDDLGTNVPRRSSNVAQHPADGGMLLFDARTGMTLLLNETAVEVWRACAEETTLAALTHRLSSIYDVETETAADHVDQLVALFAEAGLLQLEPAEP